jgi:hypothetical protein
LKLYDARNSSTVTIDNGLSVIQGDFDINNLGQVVWQTRSDGYSPNPINLYYNGAYSQISTDSNANHDVRINDQGQIIWTGWNSSSSSDEIFLYDPKSGGNPKQISNGNSGNYQINNNGQIVWGHYIFNEGIPIGEIYLYDSASNTTQAISQGHSPAGEIKINDFGQIIWCNYSSGGYDLYISNPGDRNNLQKIDKIDNPTVYCINNSGQIAYGKGNSGYAYTADIYLATPQVEVAKFVFPVLGISNTDPLKNLNDPLQDGWTGPGVGQHSAKDGHLGQDYYLKSRVDCAGKPVYAIYTGEVVEVMNHDGPYFGWPCPGSTPDHGWGPVVVLKHTSDTGFKVSDNAIVPLGDCGTDRNPKVIYSLYGHLSRDSIKDITIGQTFNTGDPIGVIGKFGVDQNNWDTNHLHFEIKDEAGFLEGSWYSSHSGQCPGSAAQACEAQGVGTGYSYRANFSPHRYIPAVFIVENQGRKANVQGAINLLMSD